MEKSASTFNISESGEGMSLAIMVKIGLGVCALLVVVYWAGKWLIRRIGNSDHQRLEQLA